MNKMKTLTLQGVTFEVVDEQARASIPEKIVQAVNGVEPDENGNVTIEISGGVSPEEVTTIVKEQFPGGVGYEEVQTVNEPLNITWDGNTEGLLGVGDMAYKVSDVVLTIEQMGQLYRGEIHASISISGGEPMDLIEFGLSQNDSLDAFSAEIVVLVLKSNATLGNFVFPEPGIYFVKVDENTFASAMTTDFPLEQTKVVTKKLDAKYLPDGVGGDKFVATFSTADGENWTCDKTLAEITEAINGGKEVVGLMEGITVHFIRTFSDGAVKFGRVFPNGLYLTSYDLVVSEDGVDVTLGEIEMSEVGVK